MACTSYKSTGCLDKLGCPPNQCPALVIRRYDTKPDFKFNVQDCDGPLDLTNLVCEASMWVQAKLKKTITVNDSYISLADGIGFEQTQVGDVIVMSRARSPEQMLVTGFDENNKLIQVMRGYNGSIVAPYVKGSSLRMFRVLNSIATTEMVKEDILQVDGTTKKDVITRSSLVYEWLPADTCLPGCYWFEFKLLKMMDSSMMLAGEYSISTPISFISYTPSQTGCGMGDGVQWVQRYPTDNDGFLIKIANTFTAENVVS